MIITSRIASGFDVELQLAGGWFLTALRLLNDSGLLMPGSASIAGVQRSFAPGWDLHINVPGREQPVLARPSWTRPARTSTTSRAYRSTEMTLVVALVPSP